MQRFAAARLRGTRSAYQQRREHRLRGLAVSQFDEEHGILTITQKPRGLLVLAAVCLLLGGMLVVASAAEPVGRAVFGVFPVSWWPPAVGAVLLLFAAFTMAIAEVEVFTMDIPSDTVTLEFVGVFAQWCRCHSGARGCRRRSVLSRHLHELESAHAVLLATGLPLAPEEYRRQRDQPHVVRLTFANGDVVLVLETMSVRRSEDFAAAIALGIEALAGAASEAAGALGDVELEPGDTGGARRGENAHAASAAAAGGSSAV